MEILSMTNQLRCFISYQYQSFSCSNQSKYRSLLFQGHAVI